MIIGCPGAGKSTLARKMGEILDLPVIHLDTHFWQPGWKMPDGDDWRKRVYELTSGDRWIMDGNYRTTFKQRLPYCDTIIYLNHSTLVCLWRIIKRIMTNYGCNRPDAAPGCPERFDLEFIKFTLLFKRKEMPKLLDHMEKNRDRFTLIQLNNNNEVQRFLENIEQKTKPPDNGVPGGN